MAFKGLWQDTYDGTEGLWLDTYAETAEASPHSVGDLVISLTGLLSGSGSVIGTLVHEITEDNPPIEGRLLGAITGTVSVSFPTAPAPPSAAARSYLLFAMNQNN